MPYSLIRILAHWFCPWHVTVACPGRFGWLPGTCKLKALPSSEGLYIGFMFCSVQKFFQDARLALLISAELQLKSCDLYTGSMVMSSVCCTVMSHISLNPITEFWIFYISRGRGRQNLILR